MSLRSHFRLRDNRQQALAQLRNQHPGSEITPLSPEARYLQLQLQDELDCRAQAWLNVDAWLEQMNIHLPDIPWQEVPLRYLARWLNPLQLSFLIEEKIWDVIQIAVSVSPLPEEALSLVAEPCSLLCLGWPQEDAGPQDAWASVTEQIPFQLRFVLGYSQLSLAQLANVEPGDLLLIKRELAHLAVGPRRLYRLSYYPNQEVIVEEQFAEHYEEFRQEEEPLHDWASLPVDIEFVLDGRTVTLAELEGIKPGTALTLNPEAEQNIKIFLNKRLFARGELVALENGSLAVEVNRVNPGLIGEMEHSDAE
ncbi:MAG TPA: FliM/FliN family flagellar motor switch protein [Buttiauxella sp.]|jgi:type III secretion protein Q